jgi:nucleoside-diphosphate-sugar epimerase
VNGRRIAVIGGTGFIGSHLTERLVADGADVLAVARTESRLGNLAAVRRQCVIALADICDPAAMIRALRRFRPEIVFFMAAHPDGTESFRQISECVQINGVGLINALQAAVAAGTEVFVYGDSAKDYGNAEAPYRAEQPASPVCSYAIVKSAGWQLCQLVACFTPMKTVALRPTLVYGPRQNRNVITHVRDCVASGRPVRLMGGSQTRDPLYIDDAVGAYVAAATRPDAWGHAIPIGGGQEVTVTALCQATVTALGGSVAVIEGAEQSRLTEIWRSASDNTDASRLLGWQPVTPLSEGLSRTVRSWMPNIRSAQEAAPAPQPDCYLLASAAGVVYRMLDRREGPDRRAAARGGRRISDRREAASIGGERSHSDLAKAIAFTNYTRASGETR